MNSNKTLLITITVTFALALAAVLIAFTLGNKTLNSSSVNDKKVVVENDEQKELEEKINVENEKHNDDENEKLKKEIENLQKQVKELSQNNAKSVDDKKVESASIENDNTNDDILPEYIAFSDGVYIMNELFAQGDPIINPIPDTTGYSYDKTDLSANDFFDQVLSPVLNIETQSFPNIMQAYKTILDPQTSMKDRISTIIYSFVPDVSYLIQTYYNLKSSDSDINEFLKNNYNYYNALYYSIPALFNGKEDELNELNAEMEYSINRRNELSVIISEKLLK